MTFDLAILGGGPAGHEAALEAAALNLSTVLVEARELGGTCLNRGCIPTKFLLGATSPAAELEWTSRLRLASGEVRLDLQAMKKRNASFIEASRKSMAKALEKAGVEIVRGIGRLAGPGSLLVDGPGAVRELRFDKLILATGSRPGALPDLKADGDAVLDSDMLLDLEAPPESLIIVGGGAIGLEMAEIFFRLGAEITIVEARDHLAPQEDPEVGEVLAATHKRRGMRLFLSARVASLASEAGKAVLLLETGERLVADKALVAIGRAPATAGLGLEKAGARLRGPGFVEVDDRLLAAPDIFCAGDANGLAMLAHTASHQARFAVRAAAGIEKQTYAPPPFPWCIFGSMEVMRVGLTLEIAQTQGGDFQVTRSPMAANPMAQAHGETRGFVQILWSEGVVRGVTAVGHGATHLAGLAQSMVAHAWKREEPEKIIFGHPGLEESLRMALNADPLPFS